MSSKHNKYEEGMKILNERFGNGKDNVISLATISVEPSEDGSPSLASVMLMRYMKMVLSTLLRMQTPTR